MTPNVAYNMIKAAKVFNVLLSLVMSGYIACGVVSVSSLVLPGGGK